MTEETEKQDPSREYSLLVLWGLIFWVVLIWVLPYFEVTGSGRAALGGGERAVESLIRARLPLAQLVLKPKYGGNLDVFIDKESFELVAYPNRPDFVRNVGKAWCQQLEEYQVGLMLASVKMKDIKTGRRMASHNCVWGGIREWTTNP